MGQPGATWESIRRDPPLAFLIPGQQGVRIPSTLQIQPSHLAVLGLWKLPMQSEMGRFGAQLSVGMGLSPQSGDSARSRVWEPVMGTLCMAPAPLVAP